MGHGLRSLGRAGRSPGGVGLLLWLLGGVIPAAAWGLATSVGPEGIDALRLQGEPYGLTGHKVSIGQVEIGRPSGVGVDKVAGESPPVVVRRLFFLNQLAQPNTHVDLHAAAVASVMISQDRRLRGVAPRAWLYGAAVGPIRDRSAQPEVCLASQQVATSNGTTVRAINYSFGEPLSRDPRPNPVLDGNSLMTLCVDWSGVQHNTLYVIAGNQGRGGIPLPTDNFNGINVAYSRRVGGRFVQLDPSNLGSEPTARGGRRPESNEGPRRSISLVAPGAEIATFDPQGRVNQPTSGSSFAAPHVTATVALLHEWGDRQIRGGRLHWSLDSRQAMVTKAVLLNSADKLEDAGDGLRLGMTRTLRDSRGRDWTDSDAYRDPAIPLHADFGTGHLNAYRAVQQLDGGFWRAGVPVPVRGWSYDQFATAEVNGGERIYAFAQPLQGGSYVAATLTWQRQVELVDGNGNGIYDLGEGFQGHDLNNLDLYLEAIAPDGTATPVWASTSGADSTEHIFFPIPATGRYRLRVVYQAGLAPRAEQPFGLAWWGMAATP